MSIEMSGAGYGCAALEVMKKEKVSQGSMRVGRVEETPDRTSVLPLVHQLAVKVRPNEALIPAVGWMVARRF